MSSVAYQEAGFEVFAGAVARHIPSLREAVVLECRRFREGTPDHAALSVSLAQYIRKHPARSPGVSPKDAGDEPYILGGIAGLNRAFLTFITEPELWQVASGLLDVEPDQLVYHSGQVVRKPAHIGAGLGWHRDYGATYIATQGARFLRLLIPLQPISQTNSGTAIVPGSHLISDKVAQSLVGVPESDDGAICPALEPGDILALHPKTLHGGGPNRSKDARDLFVIQYADGNAPLLHSDDSEPYTGLHRQELVDALQEHSA